MNEHSETSCDTQRPGGSERKSELIAIPKTGKMPIAIKGRLLAEQDSRQLEDKNGFSRHYRLSIYADTDGWVYAGIVLNTNWPRECNYYHAIGPHSKLSELHAEASSLNIIRGLSAIPKGKDNGGVSTERRNATLAEFYRSALTKVIADAMLAASGQ